MKFPRSQVFPDSVSEELRTLARMVGNGDAISQRKMGMEYQSGATYPINNSEAKRWFTKAVKSGDADSACALARIERDQKKYDSEIAWYEQGARMGHGRSMHALGRIYARGKTIPKNLEKAASWYHRAAQTGDASSQVVYGLMLRDGRGIAKDNVGAYLWLGLALTGKLSDDNRSLAGKAKKNLETLLTQEEIGNTETMIEERKRRAVPRPKTVNSGNAA
jgi:TPR repeat protein